jgi:hypothetical protein
MFDSNATDVAFSINVQECVFIEISCLGHIGGPELDVQSIGVLEILNLHGLNDLSKNAL